MTNINSRINAGLVGVSNAAIAYNNGQQDMAAAYAGAVLLAATTRRIGLNQEPSAALRPRKRPFAIHEFLRQGDLQERSLNQQTTKDWQYRIDKHAANARDAGPSQRNHRAEQIQLRADALRARNGVTPTDAVAVAKKEATGPHVLHGRDQYPGGNPPQFTGLGDGRVNGAYGCGSQQGGQRTKLVDTVADSLGDIRRNVDIKVLVAR